MPEFLVDRRPHELVVVEAEKVQMFGLPRGDLRGAEQVSRFVKNLSSIVAVCARPGPFIYSVLPSRIERRWP